MTRIRQLTGAKVAEIMARLLEGPGLPIQPGTCAACLRVRLAPHRGVPTPSRAHELGYAFEIAYDERLPQPKIDAVIAAELARYIVGACRGDVTDEDLIADVCMTMFAVRLPIRVPVLEPIEVPECVPAPAIRSALVQHFTIKQFRRSDVDLVAVERSGSIRRYIFISFKVTNSDLDHIRNWLVHFMP
jgi:hypothetical protein